MLVELGIAASFLAIVIILASILGAVDRPERVWFVGGIALFILGHAFITRPARLGMWLALAGLVLAAASAVPLLRQHA